MERTRYQKNSRKIFLEFLEIRSDKTATHEERVKKLDELFQRAVVQLTMEKLEKSDFHILRFLMHFAKFLF